MHDKTLYCTIPQAGAMAYGYGVSASYKAARAGCFPLVEVNGRKFVIVAELLRQAGVDPQAK